jgi:hypothetical protein
MSEESLRSFLDKIETDEAFREKLMKEPTATADEFELSPAERAALISNDEDALRRLVGAETSGYMLSLSPVSSQSVYRGTGIMCIQWGTQMTFTDNENPPCLHSPC